MPFAIGATRRTNGRCWVRGLDEETTEANPWLIAAAPDVLAALERILARVETLKLFTKRGEEAKVLEQARAAIGKATGR